MTQRRYTNNTNLSMYAQVYLATDWYDKEEAGLSVTTLLKPIKSVVFETESLVELYTKLGSFWFFNSF